MYSNYLLLSTICNHSLAVLAFYIVFLNYDTLCNQKDDDDDVGAITVRGEGR